MNPPLLSEKQFRARGCELNFAEGPEAGPPLILLHGITSWWQSFLPVMHGLILSHHVFAIDMRGHGRSGRAKSYLVNDYADDLVDFVSAKAPGDVSLVGHSMGAHVVLASAGRIKPRGLVLEDAPLTVRDGRIVTQGPQAVFAAWQRLKRENSDFESMRAAVEALKLEATPLAARVRAKTLLQMDAAALDVYGDGDPFIGYDPQALVEELDCPVLALRADETIFARLDAGAADAIANLARQGYALRMAGAGHNIHGETPDRWLGAVEAFLHTL
jgi:pimeloyl-ACP methyl ester carboxylesterase